MPFLTGLLRAKRSEHAKIITHDDQPPCHQPLPSESPSWIDHAWKILLGIVLALVIGTVTALYHHWWWMGALLALITAAIIFALLHILQWAIS